jgi:hypothetical protein
MCFYNNKNQTYWEWDMLELAEEAWNSCNNLTANLMEETSLENND